MLFWKIAKQKYSHQPVNCGASRPVIPSLTCGRIIAVWARKEAEQRWWWGGCSASCPAISVLLITGLAHLPLPSRKCGAATSTPAPWTFKPTMEGDDQGRDWERKEGAGVAAGLGRPGSEGSFHPSPLTGVFLSHLSGWVPSLWGTAR